MKINVDERTTDEICDSLLEQHENGEYYLA